MFLQAIVAAEQRDRIVSKLHSILRPFFLRRLKADVDLELPAKQEIVLYAHMTPYQVKINDGLLDKSLIVCTHHTLPSCTEDRHFTRANIWSIGSSGRRFATQQCRWPHERKVETHLYANAKELQSP